MVEESGEQSQLSRHEYWESTFNLELNNFKDHGDDGEVWFGKDVQKKTVNYILGRFTSTESLSLLDVGTGNGALLFKLAKKDFKGKLKGIDYSEASIQLSCAIQAYLAEQHEDRAEVINAI